MLVTTDRAMINYLKCLSLLPHPPPFFIFGRIHCSTHSDPAGTNQFSQGGGGLPLDVLVHLQVSSLNIFCNSPLALLANILFPSTLKAFVVLPISPSVRIPQTLRLTWCHLLPYEEILLSTCLNDDICSSSRFSGLKRSHCWVLSW